MKYLNLAFIAAFMLILISCGGNTKKSTHIEETESLEINEDNDIDDVIEEDETELLEAAMDALQADDRNLAVEKIRKAAENIKGYVGEMDDPEHANNAIETLLSLATKIKSGAKMSADELEEALLKLEFFSDDDSEIEDEEIEDSNSDS